VKIQFLRQGGVFNYVTLFVVAALVPLEGYVNMNQLACLAVQQHDLSQTKSANKIEPPPLSPPSSAKNGHLRGVTAGEGQVLKQLVQKVGGGGGGMQKAMTDEEIIKACNFIIIIYQIFFSHISTWLRILIYNLIQNCHFKLGILFVIILFSEFIKLFNIYFFIFLFHLQLYITKSK